MFFSLVDDHMVSFSHSIGIVNIHGYRQFKDCRAGLWILDLFDFQINHMVDRIIAFIDGQDRMTLIEKPLVEEPIQVLTTDCFHSQTQIVGFDGLERVFGEVLVESGKKHIIT